MPKNKLQSTVKIRGPKNPGCKVLRPPAGLPRPKATRFYNPDGEPFEDECPLYWARQLVASGDAEIVADANPSANVPEAPARASEPKPPKAPKGDK